MERDVLIQQIDRRLGRIVPPEDLARSRLIFWLYYRSGLSASAIAGMPGVGLSTKGVESAILRLTRALRDVLVEPKKITAEESERSGTTKRRLPLEHRSFIEETRLSHRRSRTLDSR